MINFLIPIDYPKIIMGIGLLVLIVLFVLYFSSSSSRKIKQSKKVISHVLRTSIKGKHYLLEDVPFVSESGEKYIADNVLINANGIYIFENKVYKKNSLLHGDENNKTMTLTDAKGENKEIPNPCLEANEYVTEMRKIIPEDVNIYSYIVLLINRLSEGEYKTIIRPFNIEEMANKEEEVRMDDHKIEEVYLLLKEYKDHFDEGKKE